jgi:hypothetical protein
MNAWLRPVRARRASFDRADLERIIGEGSEKARVVAGETISDVRRALKLL